MRGFAEAWENVSLFTEEFQMEPLAPNAISYDTTPTDGYVLAN